MVSLCEAAVLPEEIESGPLEKVINQQCGRPLTRGRVKMVNAGGRGSNRGRKVTEVTLNAAQTEAGISSSETADLPTFLNTIILRREISREQHFAVSLMPEVKGEWTAPAIKTATAIQTATCYNSLKPGEDLDAAEEDPHTASLLKTEAIASSHSVPLTSWADERQGRFISEGDMLVAVGDVRLLPTSFKALNGRRGLMAAIEQSQLCGYFYNILFLVHSAMELKHHPLCAFVLVLP